MSGFRFHDALWLLAALPVLMAVIHARRTARRASIPFSSLAPFRGIPATFAERLNRALPALRLLGLLALVVALARPQQGREEFRVRSEGIAIEMAIDRSGSMDALDFSEGGELVNRLHVVKRVFREFVQGDGARKGRTDDHVGLVVFGGFAESRCPLTLDHGALLQILDKVEIPGTDLDPRELQIAREFLKEEGATAIGDGLALAIQRVKDSPAKSRIVILLSDGAQTAGVIEPLEAAALAKAAGVKVYTIGIGSSGFAPFRVTDQFGRQVLRHNKVEMDEPTLQAIARETNGEYFNARDTDALERVVARIDELERTETEGVLYTDYKEWFAAALVPGLVLLLLDLLLRSTRLSTLP